MCNCVNWCRDWSETLDNKLPPSKHAPECEDYILEEFLKINFDGNSCVIETNDLVDMTHDLEEGKYTIQSLKMTRDQFEKLNEFTGW